MDQDDAIYQGDMYVTYLETTLGTEKDLFPSTRVLLEESSNELFIMTVPVNLGGIPKSTFELDGFSEDFE